MDSKEQHWLPRLTGVSPSTISLTLNILFLICIAWAAFSRSWRHQTITQYKGRLEMVPYTASLEDDFHPAPVDVAIVKAMLHKAARLPPELLDMLLDHAEYWPRSRTIVNYEASRVVNVYGQTQQRENILVARSPPVGFQYPPDRWKGDSHDNEVALELLRREHKPDYFQSLLGASQPSLPHPVRKVVFHIKSADQGWSHNTGDYGTFRGSWTWFEAGLERFDASKGCSRDCSQDLHHESLDTTPGLPRCALRPIIPQVVAENDTTKLHHGLEPSPIYTIQKNRTAEREPADYIITWSCDDGIDPDSEDGEELEARGRGRGSGTGEFVRQLKVGDVITIWAKARFLAWANKVHLAGIDIYWAM